MSLRFLGGDTGDGGLPYMTFCGFWIFDNRVVQLETYSAAITVTQPREIARYAKVFEHYSDRAVYGQQARDLISQALADFAGNSISSNSEQHP
jgi:hypothetical protein